MEINNYHKWKSLPINYICTKRFSKIAEERIWYAEWRYVYINIINVLANYLNRKDPRWDEGIDNNTITTEELIAHMRLKLEQKGFDFEGRVGIVKSETEKLRR